MELQENLKKYNEQCAENVNTLTNIVEMMKQIQKDLQVVQSYVKKARLEAEEENDPGEDIEDTEDEDEEEEDYEEEEEEDESAAFCKKIRKNK